MIALYLGYENRRLMLNPLSMVWLLSFCLQSSSEFLGYFTPVVNSRLLHRKIPYKLVCSSNLPSFGVTWAYLNTVSNSLPLSGFSPLRDYSHRLWTLHTWAYIYGIIPHALKSIFLSFKLQLKLHLCTEISMITATSLNQGKNYSICLSTQHLQKTQFILNVYWGCLWIYRGRKTYSGPSIPFNYWPAILVLISTYCLKQTTICPVWIL